MRTIVREKMERRLGEIFNTKRTKGENRKIKKKEKRKERRPKMEREKTK